eukprot:scaffold18862_cov55-Attheya_sp.AAC.3
MLATRVLLGCWGFWPMGHPQTRPYYGQALESVFCAALSNAPLIMLRRAYRPVPPKKDKYDDITVSAEDEIEWVDRVERGEYIPAQVLSDINVKLLNEKKHILLVPTVGSYEHDKH